MLNSLSMFMLYAVRGHRQGYFIMYSEKDPERVSVNQEVEVARRRKKRSKVEREQRAKQKRSFPKAVANQAEKVATVMVAKNMTTGHYISDGAMGPSSAMVLVTLDPKVVEAIVMVLKAIGGNIQPADMIEAPDASRGERIPLEGGVAMLALGDNADG